MMGLAFMAIGLVNKGKWQKNRKSWKDLGKRERRILAITMLILGLLVAAGVVFFYLAGKGIC